MATTTFVIPNFDKSIKDKVNDAIEVISPTALCQCWEASGYVSAISTNGFPSNTDGVYVFAMKIEEAGNGDMPVGFTDVKKYDSKKAGLVGTCGIAGVSLSLFNGIHCPAFAQYLRAEITKQAKEIVSIFVVLNKKKEVRWLVDGVEEGALLDVTKNFKKSKMIFPCVSLSNNGQRVRFIPFDQIEYRSPKIDQMMKEFNEQQHQEKPIEIINPTEQKESGKRRQREDH